MTNEMSTKEKIIMNAINLFYHQGYNDTSIRKIAEDSGISHGAIFKHFKGKADLGLLILDRYLKNVYELSIDYFRQNVPLEIHSEYFFILYFSIHFKLLSSDKKFASLYCELFKSIGDDFVKLLNERSKPIWDLTNSPLNKTNEAIWELSVTTVTTNDLNIIDFLLHDKISYKEAINFVFSTYLNTCYPENQLTKKEKDYFWNEYILPMDISNVDIYKDYLIRDE